MTVKELRKLLKGIPGDTEIAVTGAYSSQGDLLGIETKPSEVDRSWLGFAGTKTKLVIIYTDLCSG